MPRVRLTLEGMRQEIVHHFASHNDEIEQLISEETERVLKNFVWREEIQNIVIQEVQSTVKKAVDDFFSYGDGRKFIYDLVSKLLRPTIS